MTCDDLQHCCPASAPVCDTQRGLCVSNDGKVSLPWTDKTKAKVSQEGQVSQVEGQMGCPWQVLHALTATAFSTAATAICSLNREGNHGLMV